MKDFLAMLIGLTIVAGMLLITYTGFTGIGLPKWVAAAATLNAVAYVMSSVIPKK